MSCDAPVSFGTVAHTSMAQSTVEAELTAASYGLKGAVCLSNLFTGLGFSELFASVPINCGSQRALRMMGTRIYSSRTKHIALRFFYLRESVNDGHITVHRVPSTNTMADICTNGLASRSSSRFFVRLSKLITTTRDGKWWFVTLRYGTSSGTSHEITIIIRKRDSKRQ